MALIPRLLSAQISRIRLSDKTSRLHPRHVVPKRGLGLRLPPVARVRRVARDQTDPDESGAAMSARLVSFDQKRTELTPGTVLVREWDRQSQRVMADDFAWNGRSYDSLSKVAFAITGTKWNGPRFFGLRDKEAGSILGERL
jgi:Protein of unknown function (DUF2924)